MGHVRLVSESHESQDQLDVNHPFMRLFAAQVEDLTPRLLFGQGLQKLVILSPVNRVTQLLVVQARRAFVKPPEEQEFNFRIRVVEDLDRGQLIVFDALPKYGWKLRKPPVGNLVMDVLESVLIC